MNAAQRNAKIARAKTLRPWRYISGSYSRSSKPRVVKVHHLGDGALRTVYGEAEVTPPPVIVPKHVLRHQRRRAQRLADLRAQVGRGLTRFFQRLKGGR